MMTGQQLLDVLRKEKPYLQEKFNLLSIAVFGSYAKGAERPDSDIDLLVEPAEPTFDSPAGLQIYLEKKLDKAVELIRKRNTLSGRFLRRIEESILYV
jgi:uncharacterized protein